MAARRRSTRSRITPNKGLEMKVGANSRKERNPTQEARPVSSQPSQPMTTRLIHSAFIAEKLPAVKITKFLLWSAGKRISCFCPRGGQRHCAAQAAERDQAPNVDVSGSDASVPVPPIGRRP